MKENPSFNKRMDSSIMTEKEDESVMTLQQPPTRIITIKKQYTVKDQKDMLSLAQKQFDYMRRRNKERLKSSRYQRHSGLSHGGGSRMSKPTKDQMKIRQLLSSLLYLSLMMHKVDDMKKILEHSDSNLYNEWTALFGPLHSPIFHMRERRIQNERVKKLFNRKLKYKAQYEETKADLLKCQDTLQQVSQAVAKLTDENKSTYILLNQRQDIEKDLAVSINEIEMRHQQILKHENTIKEMNIECSQLHTNNERIILENKELLKNINIYEASAEKATKEIFLLRDEIKEKDSKIKDYVNNVVTLKKDLELSSMQLNQEQSIHKDTKKARDDQVNEYKRKVCELQSLLETTETKMKQLESCKAEEIVTMQQKVTDAHSEIAVKSKELEMLQSQLSQTRSDLESKSTSLVEALGIIKSETTRNKSLEDQNSLITREVSSLNTIAEKAKAEKAHLNQSMIEVKTDLENELNKAKQEMASLKDDLKQKELLLMSKETEVTKLNCKVESFEKSLSEAMQSVKEQKTKIDYEANDAINQSIEKLITDNGRIFQMMESIKDGLLADIRDTLKKQRAAEEKAALIQNQLIDSDKNVVFLTSAKRSLENSLSEALAMKSLAEEQKQKLFNEESNALKSSIQKLLEENSCMNKMIIAMKENLVQQGIQMDQYYQQKPPDQTTTISTQNHQLESKTIDDHHNSIIVKEQALTVVDLAITTVLNKISSI